MSQPLPPQARRLLGPSNPFGAPLWFVEETTSTMDGLRSLARDGAPFGTVLVAGRQSAGRGRLPGRRWEDRDGLSLLATLLLDPGLASLPGLTLRVGLALARACETFRAAGEGPPVQVKWPNDLMIGDKKLAGVLCEAGPAGLLVGFGINVGQRDFPADLAERATSLALASPWPDPRLEAAAPHEALLEACLGRIAEALDEEDWRAAAEERLWNRGRRVLILPGRPGSEPGWEGELLGLDEEGRLLAAGAEGEGRIFLSAEISLR